jgi:hypothetical protein
MITCIDSSLPFEKGGTISPDNFEFVGVRKNREGVSGVDFLHWYR